MWGLSVDSGRAGSSGHWYAPDFHLPSIDVYVEVKGQQDPDDAARWAAFRATGKTLAVLDHAALDRLRMTSGAEGFLIALSFFFCD